MNFLNHDQEQAQKEMNCFDYCTERADVNFDIGNYAVAAAYYENATRSLKALDRMQSEKEQYDKAAFILGQIKADHHQVELLIKLRSAL